MNETPASDYRYETHLPDDLRPELDNRLAALTRNQTAQKIWAGDATLWSDDPIVQKSIDNRLGWLTSVTLMHGIAGRIDEFVATARADGFRHALLVGMGGSSLAPEVLQATFGTGTDHLALHVLDNTSPDAVRAAENAIDLDHTLFIVSSKSGTTTETMSFFHYFFEKVAARHGDTAGRQFIAITDPGTTLAALAHEHGFRETFVNPADIGGRYSALSYFGLVPAALIGVDLTRLLEHAQKLIDACAQESATQNPGLFLGGALGALGQRGRDKLTLLLSPSLATLGTWIEQLVAESSGKLGVGIVPVEDEPLGDVANYESDRLFVAIGMAGEPDPLPAAQADALRQAGHPVLRWQLPDVYHLGAEFFRWKFATAVACMVLGVNAFDEPNVTESKDTTKRLLQDLAHSGTLTEPTPLAHSDRLLAFGDPSQYPAHDDVRACLDTLLERAAPGDYVALMTYLHRTAEVHAALGRLRELLRARTHMATTLGYGPRFLHSTGQLHKGGDNNGIFIQITADPEQDLEIPGAPYSFAQLQRAQALGDLQVLQRHSRRALRLHLGDDPVAALRQAHDLIASLPIA